MARLVSSRVRTEIKHATSISNADVWPASCSTNSIAFGNGRTASRTRATATSISNACFARLLNRTQASLIDVAHDRIDVGLFYCSFVQAVAGGAIAYDIGCSD